MTKEQKEQAYKDFRIKASREFADNLRAAMKRDVEEMRKIIHPIKQPSNVIISDEVLPRLIGAFLLGLSFGATIAVVICLRVV